jgi:hypothetical protein
MTMQRKSKNDHEHGREKADGEYAVGEDGEFDTAIVQRKITAAPVTLTRIASPEMGAPNAW